MDQPKNYLIYKKGRGYYASNSQNYSWAASGAGRYTQAEAFNEVEICGKDVVAVWIGDIICRIEEELRKSILDSHALSEMLIIARGSK